MREYKIDKLAETFNRVTLYYDWFFPATKQEDCPTLSGCTFAAPGIESPGV
ncbi:hypothetical protein IT084_05480 [Desulfallas sp. Bu1-1]|uniref:hypothetical protein n=1 Tax=Desulfallas sp. Bu1-1 TaxID=2787620 RepID=UPI00189D1CE7|nr:hypothetical protein [Desulfallas sp. Bu1-1]MBF7082430.1 hypothetical protein [Desulfallas sp. Bu1-1]